jgi:hypothetical protein
LQSTEDRSALVVCKIGRMTHCTMKETGRDVFKYQFRTACKHVKFIEDVVIVYLKATKVCSVTALLLYALTCHRIFHLRALSRPSHCFGSVS